MSVALQLADPWETGGNFNTRGQLVSGLLTSRLNQNKVSGKRTDDYALILTAATPCISIINVFVATEI